MDKFEQQHFLCLLKSQSFLFQFFIKFVSSLHYHCGWQSLFIQGCSFHIGHVFLLHSMTKLKSASDIKLCECIFYYSVNFPKSLSNAFASVKPGWVPGSSRRPPCNHISHRQMPMKVTPHVLLCKTVIQLSGKMCCDFFILCISDGEQVTID